MENWFANEVTVNQHYYKKLLKTASKGQKREATDAGKCFSPSLGQGTSTNPAGSCRFQKCKRK